MGILLSCPSFSEQADIEDPDMYLDKLKLQITQQKEELEQLKAQTWEQEDGLEAVRGQSRGYTQAIEVMKQHIQDLTAQLEEQDTLFSQIKEENQILKQEIATLKTERQKRIEDLEVALLLNQREIHTAATEHPQQNNGSEIAANNMEQKIKGTRKLATTTFVWRLASFEQLVKKARLGKQILVSDPFYTNRHGYKMKVKIYPNGHGTGQGTHVSVYIVLMKGEYDAILSWPFARKVILSIIDQEDNLADRRNIVVSFKEKDPIKCFGKPQSGDNEAYGFQKVASLEDLQTRKYVVGGNMFIQVEIMNE